MQTGFIKTLLLNDFWEAVMVHNTLPPAKIKGTIIFLQQGSRAVKCYMHYFTHHSKEKKHNCQFTVWMLLWPRIQVKVTETSMFCIE